MCKRESMGKSAPFEPGLTPAPTHTPPRRALTAEDILASEFTREFPQRYEDDYLRGDDSARDSYIADVEDFVI